MEAATTMVVAVPKKNDEMVGSSTVEKNRFLFEKNSIVRIM